MKRVLNLYAGFLIGVFFTYLHSILEYHAVVWHDIPKDWQLNNELLAKMQSKYGEEAVAEFMQMLREQQENCSESERLMTHKDSEGGFTFFCATPCDGGRRIIITARKDNDSEERIFGADADSQTVNYKCI